MYVIILILVKNISTVEKVNRRQLFYYYPRITTLYIMVTPMHLAASQRNRGNVFSNTGKYASATSKRCRSINMSAEFWQKSKRSKKTQSC